MLALFTSPVGRAVADASAWSYGFPSLSDLVTRYGVRGLEVDVVYDDVGGRYEYRAGPKLAQQLRVTSDSTGQRAPPEAQLNTPGWKVVHVPDFDYQPSCYTLAQCLAPLARWSAANPQHDPLFIRIELKYWNASAEFSASGVRTVNSLLASGTALGPPSALAYSPPPNATHVTLLQRELLGIFNRSRIYTPGNFAAGYSTLRRRLQRLGWPPLSSLRGKVVFIAVGHAPYLAALNATDPRLRTSLMFVERWADQPESRSPECVFMQVDAGTLTRQATPGQAAVLSAGERSNATREQRAAALQTLGSIMRAMHERMANDTGSSYMLRFYADEGTVEARSGDTARALAAASAGVHFVHTDYPNGWTSACGFASNYSLYLAQASADGKPSLAFSPPAKLQSMACNPVAAPKECRQTSAGQAPIKACTCYKAV